MPDSESDGAQGPGETKSHVKAANRISLIYWRPGATKPSATSLGICPAIWSNIEKGVTRTLTVRITKVAPELSQILKWKYNISRELKEAVREIIQTKRILPRFSDLVSVP